MKIPTPTSLVFLSLCTGVLALLVFFFYKKPIDDSQAFIIAEGTFLSLAKHLKMMPNEFELLPSNRLPSGEKLVVFVWQSKTKPDCKIEVDVDKMYANARPTWICN
jgi:hypothetical protein